MSRILFTAALATLAVALSPLAQAGVSNPQLATSTIVRAQDNGGGALPAVTVNAATRFADYTGMAPAPVAADVSVWTPAFAQDYTGEAPAPSALLLASTPVWNIALAHDYVTE